jgi:glycosyl hydrolase family 65
VVGIDRVTAREDLARAGADFVLGDVAELDLGERLVDPWLLVYEGFDPVHETHREALTTLGNGYLATRGALPEHRDEPDTACGGGWRTVSGAAGQWLAIAVTAVIAACALTSVIGEPARWRRSHPDDERDDEQDND